MTAVQQTAKPNLSAAINAVEVEINRHKNLSGTLDALRVLQQYEQTEATLIQRIATLTETAKTAGKVEAEQIVADARLVAAKIKSDSEAERAGVTAETIALIDRRDTLRHDVAKLQAESEALQLRAHRLRQALES